MREGASSVFLRSPVRWGRALALPLSEDSHRLCSTLFSFVSSFFSVLLRLDLTLLGRYKDRTVPGNLLTPQEMFFFERGFYRLWIMAVFF